MKLAEHDRCCGCAACAAACARGAIAMAADAEGFLCPQVDVAKCVSCGLCERACPVLNPGEPRQAQKVYAAQAKDAQVRGKSSSGGVFTLLARQTLARGGVVYGALFDPSDRCVRHVAAETEEELAALRGSKYVQSDLGNVHRAVRDQLKKGRPVLFSGSPCQVAGLKRFLGRDDDNLLTVDFVCHAVPSPLVWQKYLAHRIAELGKEDVPLTGVSFRNKKFGWYQFSLCLTFADGTRHRADVMNDLFLTGFLTELYNRRSCHACSCRELKSGADLTLADYWLVHLKFPEIDDDRGTSLVLVNSDRGAAAWAAASDGLAAWESDWADATRANPAILRSAPACAARDTFFAEMEKRGFREAVLALRPDRKFPESLMWLLGRGKTDDED